MMENQGMNAMREMKRQILAKIDEGYCTLPRLARCFDPADFLPAIADLLANRKISFCFNGDYDDDCQFYLDKNLK